MQTYNICGRQTEDLVGDSVEDPAHITELGRRGHGIQHFATLLPVLHHPRHDGDPLVHSAGVDAPYRARTVQVGYKDSHARKKTMEPRRRKYIRWHNLLVG